MGGRHFVESHKRLPHHHIRQVEPLGDGFVVIHQVVVAGGDVEAVPSSRLNLWMFSSNRVLS